MSNGPGAGSVAGLFAGIGGLELGFSRAGLSANSLCEIDPFAQAVLRARFPGVSLSADVTKLKSLSPDTSIVTAGFPCQDLSSSGQKGGLEGARSGLVAEVFRLLRRSNVEWVVIENVPFMLQLRRGEAISAITIALESLGFAWAYRVIDSHAFGLPQRRRRVFLVASRTGDPREVLLSVDKPNRQQSDPRVLVSSGQSIGFYWTEGTFATGLALDAIPPLKGGSSIGIPSSPAILLPTGEVVTPELRDAERLQGFPKDWTKPAETVGRSSFRWRLIGNAVTVDVAEWVAGRLIAPRRYEASQDLPMSPSDPWPTAAWGAKGERFMSSVSNAPVDRKPIPIADFLRFPSKPLSARAINGFLGRVAKGNLAFPSGFIHRLREAAEINLMSTLRTAV